MSLHPSLLIVLIGLLYILAFGALSFMRRQGLSLRFAIEGLIVTAIGAGLVAASVPLHPLLFLVILYLITARVRLLVDLGNFMTSRRRYAPALAIYRLALCLWPDAVSRQIVLINRGVTQLRMGESEAAYDTLEEALADEDIKVGAKYQAAGYYNLGLAARRTGSEPEAVLRFNQAIDALPNSIYARAAQRALQERTSDEA
jgi:tetratricopeptide (TPR) repeat protein